MSHLFRVVWMELCVSVCVSLDMCVWIFVWVCLFVCVCVSLWMCVCVCVCLRVCVCIHACTCMRLCVSVRDSNTTQNKKYGGVLTGELDHSPLRRCCPFCRSASTMILYSWSGKPLVHEIETCSAPTDPCAAPPYTQTAWTEGERARMRCIASW